MGKIVTKISIFFDRLKDFIIFVLLVLAIIILICFIIHNTLKIVQFFNRYSGEYRNLAEVENGDLVNVYQIGDGEKTIVILPGFGVQSPIIMYKNIAEELKNEYKVVIIEYPGYGLAQSSKNERTNENIAKDIKQALEFYEINGPYILMPHSISSLYAMKFTEMYPELVEKVILVDGEYPAILTTAEGTNYINSTRFNVKISNILEYTGFARILSYINPEMFYIYSLEETNVVSKSDIKLYRKMIATQYLSSSMLNEIKNLNNNINELQNYVFPENIPVLHILASETISEVDKTYSKGSLKKFAEKTISNSQIQKIVNVNGTHMLTLSNTKEIIKLINEFN